MKILITGGCGFIGTNLINYILEYTQYQVVNVDKQSYAGSKDNILLPGSERYIYEDANIMDARRLDELFEYHKPDYVIHLAAESHVDQSIIDANPFIHTNIIGTYHLLLSVTNYWRDLSKIPKSKFRFLHVSTDEVYGSLSKDGIFTEQSQYAPNSPYSASKASSDHLVNAWHATYGLPTIISNCSNNYGPFQMPEKFIPRLILRAINGESLPIYGDGGNIRDWLYVKDHVLALLSLIEKADGGSHYNIGGSCEKKNITLAYEICDILNKCIELKPENVNDYRELISFVNDRPGHDYRYAVDSTKIFEDFGWKPTIPLEMGLRKTIEWYLSNTAWLANASSRLEAYRKKQEKLKVLANSVSNNPSLLGIN